MIRAVNPHIIVVQRAIRKASVPTEVLEQNVIWIVYAKIETVVKIEQVIQVRVINI